MDIEANEDSGNEWEREEERREYSSGGFQGVDFIHQANDKR